MLPLSSLRLYSLGKLRLKVSFSYSVCGEKAQLPVHVNLNVGKAFLKHLKSERIVLFFVSSVSALLRWARHINPIVLLRLRKFNC